MWIRVESAVRRTQTGWGKVELRGGKYSNDNWSQMEQSEESNIHRLDSVTGTVLSIA